MQVERKRLPKFCIELSEDEARALSDETDPGHTGYRPVLNALITHLRRVYYSATGEAL